MATVCVCVDDESVWSVATADVLRYAVVAADELENDCQVSDGAKFSVEINDEGECC